MSEPVTLDPESVRAVAHAVVALLTDTPPTARLVDAAELADLLGVSRAWIYDNAELLDPVRLGDGDRPRLRFDPETALAAWRHREPEPEPQPEPPRRRAAPTTAALLPIKRTPA
jgi:hypothetical protein